MRTPYLEVTYRQGKPFAAYLYLDRRPGDRAATTKRDGDLVIDYAPDGRPIGIEFMQVAAVDLSAVNRVLERAHETSLSANDLSPLSAA
ncbi:MAG TPA: DUF2283 domain-containing protein [Tepidisphaeraceae bacterium]|nr:DUF2283 domain-containing protein [Tepidisphaeraceae bacterium]